MSPTNNKMKGYMMKRPLTSYSVVCIPRQRGYVNYYLMFSDEKKAELVGRSHWDSPQVCADRMIEDGNYEMMPGREDGDLIFFKFNP